MVDVMCSDWQSVRHVLAPNLLLAEVQQKTNQESK